MKNYHEWEKQSNGFGIFAGAENRHTDQLNDGEQMNPG